MASSPRGGRRARGRARLTDATPPRPQRRGRNNLQQAIRDAAENGGYRYRWWKVNDLEHNEGYNGLQLRALSEHLHDPDFWKALATARKWEDVNAWRFHWHRFIDQLADGKDAESFFAEL
jgi:hypothetical protein